jgi:hypothetical protein
MTAAPDFRRREISNVEQAHEVVTEGASGHAMSR